MLGQPQSGSAASIQISERRPFGDELPAPSIARTSSHAAGLDRPRSRYLPVRESVAPSELLPGLISASRSLSAVPGNPYQSRLVLVGALTSERSYQHEAAACRQLVGVVSTRPFSYCVAKNVVRSYDATASLSDLRVDRPDVRGHAVRCRISFSIRRGLKSCALYGVDFIRHHIFLGVPLRSLVDHAPPRLPISFRTRQAASESEPPDQCGCYSQWLVP